MIREDLASCYPADYYTHESQGDVSDAESAAGLVRNLRDTMRRAVRAAMQGIPSPVMLLLLGKILALSPRLRSRAFFHLVDELVPRWPLGSRALEVGCGTGALMVKLQWAGWEVEGVEWDPVAADVARQRTGRPIWGGDFFETALPKGEFHLVVLSHVLEHLDDPTRALERIKELLAPGGRAVLFYPNPYSAGARLFGTRWWHWDPPRHFVLPPLYSLASAATRVELDPIKRRTRTGASIDCFGRTEARQTSTLLPHKTPTSHAVALLGRLLVAFGFGIGEEAIIVLRKPFRELR